MATHKANDPTRQTALVEPATASRHALIALLAPALGVVLVHLAVGRGYGYFRDEFYYLACADHLAWGYVDHPPLSVFVLWLLRAVAGDSVQVIRLAPAIAHGAAVCVAGLTARAFGGSPFSWALAGLCTAIAPVLLALSTFYSMNAFDVLIWTAAAYLLALIFAAHRQDEGGASAAGAPRALWLALGVTLGLGLLNKISVLWLGFGLGAGLLATSQRRLLRTAGPWMAGGIAALMFLPHVLWQMQWGWPTLEFIRRATEEKMAGVSPLAFLAAQLQDLHPLAAPIWIAGLAYLLCARSARPFQALGVMYVAVFALLVVNQKSRTGYLAPAYPMLFAAGSVVVAHAIDTRGWRWAKPVLVAVLLVGGAATAPFALPILDVPSYVRYANALGQEPSTEEKKEVGALPQFFADMHGWDEMVQEIARVYRTLPPEDQRDAGIITSNYGEAGAVDVLGPQYGLPRAVSGHNNYWLWGPRNYSGRVLIVWTPTTRARLAERFDQVEEAGKITCGDCMPYENNRPVFIARNSKRPLSELWPQLKHFD